MGNMPLTPEQAVAVKKIMDDARKELDEVLHKHTLAVEEAVKRIDAQKAEKLRELIKAA